MEDDCGDRDDFFHSPSHAHDHLNIEFEEKIISTWYHNGNVVSGSNQTVAANWYETELQNQMLFLDQEPIHQLFDHVKILKTQKKLKMYLCALLNSTLTLTIPAKARRFNCVQHALDLISDSEYFTKGEINEIIDRIYAVLRLLTPEESKILCEKVLMKLHGNDKSPHLETLVEVMSQLALNSGVEYCEQVVHSMKQIKWDPSRIVLFSSTLVELSKTDRSILEAMEKISSYLHCINESIDTEDVPSIIYQLTSLSSKSSNQDIVLELIDNVVDILDSLVDSLYVKNTMQYVMIRKHTQVFSTLIHHISLLLCKDQVISDAILKGIKTNLFNAESNRDEVIFSRSRLVLSLLALQAPRIKDSVLTSICDLISSKIKFHCDVNSTHWIAISTWQNFGKDSVPLKIKETFQDLIEKMNSVEAIMPPLVKIAFHLLSENKMSYKAIPIESHRNALCTLKGSISILPQEENSDLTVLSLSVFLLHEIFIHFQPSRHQIIRDILSLLLHCDNSKFHCLEFFVIAFFDCLSKYCLQSLLEVCTELLEIFLKIPSMHPMVAAEFIRVLLPLFQTSLQFSDRCSLALRKASFSKDITGRQCAISALMSLLKNTLHLTQNKYLENDCPMSQTSQLSNRISAGLSVDEIIAMSKRFLQHQRQVRRHLYSHFVSVSIEYPFFAGVCVKIILSQLSLYLVESSPRDQLNGEMYFDVKSKSKLTINVNKLFESNGNQKEAFCELLESLFNIAQASLSILHGSLLSDNQAGSLFIYHCKGDLHVDNSVLLVFNTIWGVARSICDNEIVQSDVVSPIASLSSYKKAMYFIEIVNTLIYCVVNTPPSLSGISISIASKTVLIQKLSLKLKELSESVVNFHKNKEKSDDSMKDNDSQLDKHEIDDLFSSYSFSELPVLKIINCELSFLINGFALIYSDAEHDLVIDEMGQASNEDKEYLQIFLNSSAVDVFHQLLLERSVICMQQITDLLYRYSEYFAISAHLEIELGKISVLQNRLQEGEFGSLYVQIIKLFSLLFRDFSKQIHNTQTDNLKLSSSSTGSNTTKKQLVLRAILGCVRCCTLTNNSDKINLLGRMFDVTCLKSSDLNRNATDLIHSIEENCQNFIKLMITIHGKNEKGECIIVSAIINDILSVLPNESKKKLSQMLLKECDERLVNPTSQLTHYLIQFFFYTAGFTSYERYQYLKIIAEAIKQCCIDSNTKESGGQRVGQETYYFVCDKSLGIAIGTTLTIIDSCLKEIELLFACLTKASTSKKFQQEQIERILVDLISSFGRCLEIMDCILHVRGYPNAVTVLLATFQKCYRVLIKLVKFSSIGISRGSLDGDQVLSPAFRELFSITTNSIAPKLQELFIHIHNSPDFMKGKAKSGNRLGKLIPDLIYLMEQLDMNILKLQSYYKGRDNLAIGKWIKKSAARDFKLKLDVIEAEQEQARENELEKQLKKKRQEDNKGKGSKRKKLDDVLNIQPHSEGDIL